jgi:hypothetical protein
MSNLQESSSPRWQPVALCAAQGISQTVTPVRETSPPWQPKQLVSFKLKPWSKENTAERQRKRPLPPPADRQTGPTRTVPTLLYQFGPWGKWDIRFIKGSEYDSRGAARRYGCGTNTEREVPRAHQGPSTKTVNVTVEAEGRSYPVKIHAQELER